MSACALSQQPYSVSDSNTTGGGEVVRTGASSSEACESVLDYYRGIGFPSSSVNIAGETTCSVHIDHDYSFPVTHVCDAGSEPVFGSQTYVVCNGSCTITHNISIETPFFQLDAVGGAQIAGAILAVWAVAWGLRVAIQVLKFTDGNQPSESES